MRTRRLRLSAIVLGVSLLAGGCAFGTHSARSTAYHLTTFRASDFVDTRAASSEWFPLTPGTQLIKEGTTLIGNRRVPYR